MPGIVSSQMPDEPRLCMTWAPPSQRLNGPTTLTRSAFGAHTANRVRGAAPSSRGMRTELVVNPLVLALAEQIQIEVGNRLSRSNCTAPTSRA